MKETIKTIALTSLVLLYIGTLIHLKMRTQVVIVEALHLFARANY